MSEKCANGHPQRGPLDYFKNGACRHCDRDAQVRYQRRRKAAVALLHAAESRGLSIGEAIALVSHADYRTLQDCQTQAHGRAT